MFCKNCGKNIGEVQTELCANCEAELNTNRVQNDKVEVIKEVGANNNKNYSANERKSKIAAGLFGIFLGSLGIHNFYLGFTGKAVAQLLISIISCGTLSAVSGIWGFIEGVLILTGSISTDANDVPLKD